MAGRVPQSVQGPDRRDPKPELGRRAADLAELEADGVVAEVIFPNTIPPFFPTGAVVARPPAPDDYELRLAGVRAHNRWLADWCAGQADRRAGIGQIFLNDLDDAIADVRWCHEHGLRGGVLVQPVPDDMKHIKPLYAPDYDPLWAVCQELGVVVNTHSGGAGHARLRTRTRRPGSSGSPRTTFFSRRPLTQMLVGGVFERFPELRFVLTEQGASWIGPLLAQLDSYHGQMKSVGRIGELKYDADRVLPLNPSEYFRRNCWVGVSFPSPDEAAARDDIGARSVHVGERLPARRVDLSAHPRGAAPRLRRHAHGRAAADPRRQRSRRLRLRHGSAPADCAERVGPTFDELSEPLRGHPRGQPLAGLHPGMTMPPSDEPGSKRSGWTTSARDRGEPGIGAATARASGGRRRRCRDHGQDGRPSSDPSWLAA